jgi:hypothetical protein
MPVAMMNDKLTKPKNMTELAHRAVDLGYHPLPIQPGMKGPTFANWQNYEATPDNINRDFPPQGIVIGCKHDNLGCIDVDVYDADLAAEIRDEFLRRFPTALERIGKAPKTALVFRLPENPYTITNTVKGKKDGVEAQVEIRTKTGQMVVYGRHPETKKAYTWPRGELWETPIEKLPMPGEWQIQDFRDWADEKIKQWAGIDDEPELKPSFTIDLGAYAGFSNDEPPKEEAVKEALGYIPADLPHDDWVQVLMALHDYYNGSAVGLDVAKNWSSAYADYNAKEVEAKWRSFKGTGVSYSTLFHYAKQYGADLSEIGRKHRTEPVQQMMQSALPEAAKPPEQPAQGASVAEDEPKPEWPTEVKEINALALPRRQWVYGTTYIRKYVSVTASAGGIGKTSLATVEGLAIATGKALLGEVVKEQANVWIVNLEDPLEEMQLRLAAAMQHYGITHAQIAGKLFMDAEDTMQMVLAAEGRDGLIQNDALLDYMAKRINALGIGVLIIDPFVSTHLVNENSNASIQAVVAMFRKLARLTGAAIHIIHHVRKGNGEDATIDSVRGAGSLIGAARAARVINKVSEDDAIKLGVDEKEARGIMRVDDGKANLAPPAEKAAYRRMIGVQLANDEWVGVATEFKLPDLFEGITAKMTRAVQDIVAGAEEKETPLRENMQAKQWVGHAVGHVLGLDSTDSGQKKKLASIIKTWIKTDVLRVEQMPDKRNGREAPCVIVGEWIRSEDM